MSDLECDVTSLTVVSLPEDSTSEFAPVRGGGGPGPPVGPLCGDPLSAHCRADGGVGQHHAAGARLARYKGAAVVDATLVLRVTVPVTATLSVTVTARVAITAVVVHNFLTGTRESVCVFFLFKKELQFKKMNYLNVYLFPLPAANFLLPLILLLTKLSLKRGYQVQVIVRINGESSFIH